MSNLSEKWDKYNWLCHAMQAGVHYRHDKSDQTPKHLRVGVNSAMVTHGALVQLLITKGVITEEEYIDALLVKMRAEVERYKAEIKRETGLDVSLEGY